MALGYSSQSHGHPQLLWQQDEAAKQATLESLGVMERVPGATICAQKHPLASSLYVALNRGAIWRAEMSTTVTLISGHLEAITAIVGPPTYPAPIQQICNLYAVVIMNKKSKKIKSDILFRNRQKKSDMFLKSTGGQTTTTVFVRCTEKARWQARGKRRMGYAGKLQFDVTPVKRSALYLDQRAQIVMSTLTNWAE